MLAKLSVQKNIIKVLDYLGAITGVCSKQIHNEPDNLVCSTAVLFCNCFVESLPTHVVESHKAGAPVCKKNDDLRRALGYHPVRQGCPTHDIYVPLLEANQECFDVVGRPLV